MCDMDRLHKMKDFAIEIVYFVGNYYGPDIYNRGMND
jgi:hypothetical protein